MLYRFSLTVLAVAFVMAALALEQSDRAEMQFQAAQKKEVVDGDLKAAIEMYRKTVAAAGSNRAVAAKALLRIGDCHERLGSAEARKAFEQVVRDYSDQRDAAAEARTRLARFPQPARGVSETAMTVRKVWTDRLVDLEGEISPDSQYLSFVDADTGDLAIHDFVTGSNRRLTDKGTRKENLTEHALSSRWSPDGKQIAYEWFNKDRCYEIRVIDLANGAPKVIIREARDTQVMVAGWSRDGRRLLVLRALDFRSGRGRDEVAWVSLVDGSVKPLSADAKGFGHLRLSPDGLHIAYERLGDIEMMSADGAQTWPLVRHPASDSVIGWTPDGSRLLFKSDRTGETGVWALRVASGKPQGTPVMLRSDIGPVKSLGITRDGALFYGRYPGREHIYWFRLDPTSGKPLSSPAVLTTRSEGVNYLPQYSPDGKSLAYVSFRGHESVFAAQRLGFLVVRDLATGTEIEYQPPFRIHSQPVWLPGGRSVLFTALKSDERQEIMLRRDLGTRETTQLFEIPEGWFSLWFNAHDVSPDGKVLYYARVNMQPPRRCMVLARDLETASERELYGAQGGACVISVSPDGQWLAVMTLGTSRELTLVPTRGGEVKQIAKFDASAPSDYLKWSRDGRFLYFSRPQPGQIPAKPELWRTSADAWQPVRLAIDLPGLTGFTLHPDGERIAFSGPRSQPAEGEVWMMENFLTAGK